MRLSSVVVPAWTHTLAPSNSDALFTPRDFDYSPYFDIVKYPFWGKDAPAKYQQLAWGADGNVYNSEEEVRALEAKMQES